ncbi:ABC transporter permease [Streptomyces ossamyceticus]|uniref:ABC transporter permease n=1 Tax=Streptomyces ossamyceticus TaxID=249581 RepID=UPI0006E33B2D|nr:ABC transporter permease [Streptomyces ossamyceticus]
MTAVTSTPVTASPPSRLRRWRKADPVLILSVLWCALAILVAVAAPLLAPYDPSQTDILAAAQGLSAQHWFGTDEVGRDIFTRVLYGARLSLLGPVLVVVIATAAGTALAIAAVWFGGWFDRLLTRVLDIAFAFPPLLLAVLSVVLFGPGLTAPVVALAVAYTPYIARVVRSAALRERHLPYIESCTLAGLSGPRICVRHILPNVLPLVRAQAVTSLGSSLLDLGAISFVGLGIQPPSAEWGLMVADGRTALLNGSPQESLAAGFMIIITVVAFNMLGERLAERAEVRA